jgi:hypothetical protein
MARAKALTTPDAAPDPAALRHRAVTALDPVCGNAAIAATFAKGAFGEVDSHEASTVLQKRVDAVKGGDLSSAEAMLTAQAAALNSLFLELTKRSGTNMGAHMGVMETYMRLALKAQSQCRATLEALVAIKNPPVVYARQANFAAGHQQVNNGALAHAGRTQSQPNKLLEAEHGTSERLDPRAAGKAGGGHQALETVGAIDRATHG